MKKHMPMQMVSKNVSLCLSACLSACLSETNFERKWLQSLTLLFTAMVYTAVIYTAVVHANISVNDGSGISYSTLYCRSLQRCCLHCTAITHVNEGMAIHYTTLLSFTSFSPLTPKKIFMEIFHLFEIF